MLDYYILRIHCEFPSLHRLVEIIDSYERQIHNLKRELETATNTKLRLEENMDSMKIEDTTPNFKSMIKVNLAIFT